MTSSAEHAGAGEYPKGENGMIVRQMMRKTPITVSPTASLYEAAQKMKEHCSATVLVVEKGSKLKGILTGMDVVTAVADSKDPKSTYVCEIMSAYPVTVDAEADISSALEIMKRTSIGRLPVIEGGSLVGLLSSDDIASGMKEACSPLTDVEGPRLSKN